MKYWKELLFSIIIISSAVVMKVSGFSINGIVLLQTNLLSEMIVKTSGMSPSEALMDLIKPFLLPFLSILILSIGLGFAAFMKDFKKKIILSALSSIAVFFIFGTYMGLFFAFAIFLSTIISSKSINLSLVVFDLILAIGIFAVVASNLPLYESTFKTELGNALTPIVSGEVKNIQNETYQASLYAISSEKQSLVYSIQTSNLNNKDELLNNVYKNFDYITSEFNKSQPNINVTPYVNHAIENSQMFSAFLRWLPLSVSFGIFIIMEFFRSLFFRRISYLTKNILEKKNKK